METILAHDIQGRENTLTFRYREAASAASGSLQAHPDAEPASKEIWSQEKTDLQRAIAETGAGRIPRVTRESVRVISMRCLSLVGGAKVVHARNASVYFGLGTASDSSTNQLIDTFRNGPLFPTPRLTGLFGTVAGDVMFRPYLGVGAETSFRFRQGPYAGLNYRPTFRDFNVIVQPAPKATRIVPELQAGLGGAKLSFYYSRQFCGIFAGCQISSSNFQLHAAGGLRIYVTPRVFIRPRIDVHWVNNFF